MDDLDRALDPPAAPENPPGGFGSIEALQAAGFTGFATVAELAASRCLEVPVARGVYLVVREPALPPEFMERSVAGHYRGQDPTEEVEALARRWVEDAVVLFIGEADGSGVRGQLQQRIKRHVRFGGGAAIGTTGGRRVWQLRDHRALRFCWISCDDPGERAAALRSAFAARHGVTPFAQEAGADGTGADGVEVQPQEESGRRPTTSM